MSLQAAAHAWLRGGAVGMMGLGGGAIPGDMADFHALLCKGSVNKREVGYQLFLPSCIQWRSQLAERQYSNCINFEGIFMFQSPYVFLVEQICSNCH